MSTLGTASASGRSRESRRGSTSTISSTRTRFPTYLPSHRATVSSGRFLPARSSSPFRARFDAEKDDGGGGAGGAAPVRGAGAGGAEESLSTPPAAADARQPSRCADGRSEEHTSELQSL